MTEMRILTVRQPWAWAIIHGGKNVENRHQNLAGEYRGPIAIHAGSSVDRSAEHRELERAQESWFGPTSPWRDAGEIYWPWHRVLGRIIGVVDLVDVHAGGEWDDDHCFHLDGYPSVPRCSPWAENDTYHLVLENPRPLTTPIPYRGALGLRRLDPDTITQITAALAADHGTRTHA